MLRNPARIISNSLPNMQWMRQSPTRNFVTSPTPLVNVEVNDKTGIAIVTMNRKPVNALSLEMLQELSNTLDALESNKTRGAIITSGCTSVFSAGLDLNELYQPDAERFKAFWSAFQVFCLKLHGSSFPTAAAISGHAPAGGCVIAINCEYRVMCPNFKIGLNETRLGVSVTNSIFTTLRNVIGHREAEKALTLGTLHSAEKALDIGLIDDISVDKAAAIERCERFLAQYKNVSSLAFAVTKNILRKKCLEELKNNQEKDYKMFWSNLILPDVQVRIGEYIQSLKKK